MANGGKNKRNEPDSIFLINIRIRLPIDAVRYGWLRINADVGGYAPFTNTTTETANATDGSYVSICSIRNGS